MDSREIRLEDKKLFDGYFKEYPQNISEMTFTNLFCWRHSKRHEFAIYEGHLIVSFMNHGKRHFYQPIGENPARIISSMIKKDKDIVFERVEKDIATSLKENFNISEQKDMDDYVYLKEDLIELKGTKFMSKRNFIKQFSKNNPEVLPLSKSTVDRFRDLHAEWCNMRDCKPGSSLHDEFIAIQELLDNFEVLDVSGICVFVGGKIEAFALGERLNDITFVEHFEKADTRLNGSYQFLLNEFARSIPKDFRFMNREQDLGIEGLKKAKLSYNPVRMIEKYKISDR